MTVDEAQPNPERPYEWHRYVGELADLTAPEAFADTVRHLAIRRTFTLLMLNHPRIATVGNSRLAHAPIAELGATATAACAGEDGAESEKAFLAAYDVWTRSLARSVRKVLCSYFPRQLWPWLLQDLVTAMNRIFWHLAGASLEGRPIRLHIDGEVLDYVLDPLPAPTVTVSTEDTARVIAEKLKAVRRAKPRAVPWKKLQNDEYGRYAVWYYRHEILGEEISAIARDYHNTEHARTGRKAGRTGSRGAGLTTANGSNKCDDRPTVRYGIRQAAKFLANFPQHGGEKTTPG